MRVKEMILAVLESTGKTQKEVANVVGMTPKQFNDRLQRGSFRADEFFELLDELGFDVAVISRENGREVTSKVNGVGRRVKQMVNGVTYDTAEADAIANSFYADGENEYTDGHAFELYVTSDGRYFFAEYTNFEGVKDRISPVKAEEAAEFIEKYGVQDQ